MKKFLLLLLLLLSSCRTLTTTTTTTKTSTRDSASKSVNVLVNSTYIDRTHTERLRPYQPKFTQGGQTPMCKFESQVPQYSPRAVDTLVITDSVYVEKLADVERHDTVRITTRDSIPYPVEVIVPGDSPVPRFYKNCTRGFFLLLLALLAYIAIRFYLHR